jgi:hypothetical protein
MYKFRRNMSFVDRSIRILVGISLLLVGPLTNIIETDMVSNVLLSVVAAIALISGITAYCFLYEVTGFDSRR